MFLSNESSQSQDVEAEFHLLFRSANWDGFATLLKVDVLTGEATSFIQDENIYVVNMVWSPDGKKLAGLTVRDFADVAPPLLDLCVFGYDGTMETCFDAVAATHPLEHRAYRPLGWPIVWTPDSKTILFISGLRDDTLSLSAADIETHEIAQTLEVTWDDLLYMGQPNWSPDASQFTVSVRLDVNPAPDSISPNGSSYLVNVETQEVSEIAISEGDRECQAGAYSNDGVYILYTCSPVENIPTYLIYNTETGETIDPKLEYQGRELSGRLMAWSHDRHRLLFWDTSDRLYIYDLDLNDLQFIGEPGVRNLFELPKWSPDDSFLAFSVIESNWGPSKVVVWELGGQKQIFMGEGTWNQEPIWRPNRIEG
jgi:Tol biopolymer transport system component